MKGDAILNAQPNNDNGSEPRRGQRSSSDTGQSTENSLADRFSKLARTLEQEDDLSETLSAIVQAAIDTVPGAGHASISAVRGRSEMVTLAATDAMSVAIDQAQTEAGEGPCLESLYDQATVRLSDLKHENRWPEFTARATKLGAGSMLSIQLFVNGDDLGALNLLSEQADAFNDESEHVGLLFASHASVALAGAQQRDNLRAAIGTREIIGQAQGILMERFKITGDQSFRLLVRASQAANRKLLQVAEELVRTGELTQN